MTTHTELLNFIAEKIGAQTYLEIGVFNPDHNFNLIKVEHKLGVDPAPEAKANVLMTSDDFFKVAIATGAKFDMIFIDGLHHADQVLKDICNAWDCISEKGFIVIHDCNPHSEKITHVPRDSREWTGNVYKAVSQILNQKVTLDFDYGCCVFPKTSTNIVTDNREVTWEYFDKKRKRLLNLISVDDGLNLIEDYANQR